MWTAGGTPPPCTGICKFTNKESKERPGITYCCGSDSDNWADIRVSLLSDDGIMDRDLTFLN